MGLTAWTLKNRTVAYLLLVLTALGGVAAYRSLGQLEFPAFTIKTAVVLTPYPGATAEEVEQQVTDPIETAVQQLSQVKEVRSLSRAGLSIVYVDIKDRYLNRDMPQIWDELRRKVSDVRARLPAGALPPQVNDDWGDEYGVFFALTGDGYSYAELKAYADDLRRELLLVPDVASVEIWGARQEVVYLEMSRARLAEAGVPVEAVVNLLNAQHRVVDAGRVTEGADELRLRPTGGIDDLEEMENLLVPTDREGGLVRLGDLVTVRRGYEEPTPWEMRHNGLPALGIGIATVSDGNVVRMGRAVKARLAELEPLRPVGMELAPIAYQADTVSEAVNGFLVNLVEAVAIVIGVLCVTMGLASGLVIGAVLLLTILGTFVGMAVFGVSLQLISLGALILALGMLVDNAIVVTEGILVRTQAGMDGERAALETVRQTAWPLLGATVVAILAFAAIGTSRDSTGEFCGSLFYVLGLSLGLSWVFAVTATPLLALRFLRPSAGGVGADPYAGRWFRAYRRLLSGALRRRVATLTALGVLLGAAVWGFGFVEQSFFPSSRRPQFMVDLWEPEGTSITRTSADAARVAEFLAGLDNTEATTTFVGQGALRFLLTYEPAMRSSAYAQVLVTVADYRGIDAMVAQTRRWLAENLPGAETKVKKFVIGPSAGAKVEARLSGPDPAVLRRLAEEVKAVFASTPGAYAVRDDWRQPVPVLRPAVAEASARRLGLTRVQLGGALAASSSGLPVGQYREGNDLLPIVLRLPEPERAGAGSVADAPVPLPGGGAVSLGQVAPRTELAWETSIIRRRNRKRTLTVMTDPEVGNADPLFRAVRPRVEALALPAGYSLEWGGEYESARDAQASLFRLVPLYFLAMAVIVVALFNRLRQPLIIFLCLPLAVVGVTAGLLGFGASFGFMALLGFLSLSGMLIKNAVVLIDQIDLEIREGKEPFRAIVDASTSRMRPVLMAALTTVLGMIPLVFDPFYSAMSVTIMGGLTFGTVLTLVVVPVLYAVFFRVRPAA